MDAVDVVGLLPTLIEIVRDRVVGYDDQIMKRFDHAIAKALRPTAKYDDLYIKNAMLHVSELIGKLVQVFDNPAGIENIELPSYINMEEFRRLYNQTQKDKELVNVLKDEWNYYISKDTNNRVKAIQAEIVILVDEIKKVGEGVGEVKEDTEKIQKGLRELKGDINEGIIKIINRLDEKEDKKGGNRSEDLQHLCDCLKEKLENKRKYHPSFRLMDIDDDLFPDGMVTFDTEAMDSNNELKTVREIIAEGWKRGETNHLMIEGEGGIGKTVTLLSLPDKFAPHYVPAIYIPLHELKEETNTIEKYIKNRILESKEQYDLLQEIVNKSWSEGPNLLLLLDGFNEIPVEHREAISEDIEQWSELPGLQIITSSRFDIHQYVALRSSFSKIELQPLSEETVSGYLENNKIGVPENPAVIKLITIPLLLTLYIKAEAIRNDRPSPFAKFKETKNAGLLIWNYLQCELWRFKNKKEESKASILALEFIAPYIAWTMQQHAEFVLDESTFFDRIDDAYNLMERHIDAHGQLPNHIKNTIRQSPGLPSIEHIGDLLKEHLCLFINNEGEYRLMHQQFREALAALHLINSSYLSGEHLSQEWNSPIDYYVMKFVVDLISDTEANWLWEQDRKTSPAIENATRNQLELQKQLHDGDFSRLDFSGLNLSNISLYPYRTNNAIIKLPTQSTRLEKTKISAKTFSAEGHTKEINTVAITPNGKYVVSGSEDCTIRVWDFDTGGLASTLEGHKDSVNAIAITPNGKYVVSGSNDRSIQIWNLETGEFIRALKGHEGWVNAVAVTPDGKHVVSGSSDRTIRIWSLESGELAKTLEGHDDWVNTVAVTPNGKYIISGAKDCTIRIWNMETGELEKTLKGHINQVMAIAVTLDGKYIISGAKDYTTCIWDMETGELSKIFGEQDTVFSVKAVAVTPNGKYIISGSDDSTIRIWNLETSELVRTLEGHNGWINAIAVTPNGKYIVSGSYDRTIRVWDLETGVPTRAMEGHNSRINAIVVTPNGKYVISGAKDCTIRMWNLETGELARMLEGHKGQINTIAITLNGKYVVSGSSDWTIRIWKVETCELIKTLERHLSLTDAATVTQNGKYVLTWDFTICIWDLETGELIRTLKGHEESVNIVAVTPNGECVVSGSDDHTIRIWNLETGELIRTLEGHEDSVNTVAVTPNGEYIVSGSDDCTIRIWDLETGKLIRTLEGHKSWVTAVAVMPNGKHVVSGALDGACLWNIETGELVRILEKGFVTSVAVTPNGRYAVSGWTDGTIRITDIETYETQTIHTPPLSLVGLDFSKADISDPELKETLRQNGAKV